MSISEKIIANRQKRNLIQMLEQLKEKNLEDSVVRQIYYPDSSSLLKIILRNIRDDLWQKKSYISSSPNYEDELSKYFETLSRDEKTLLCFFPNYTSQVDNVISELPIFEVLASTIDEWYKIAKCEGLHFFLCSSSDLSKGVALDVYEADPVVHNTAGAVFDLYYWNV